MHREDHVKTGVFFLRGKKTLQQLPDSRLEPPGLEVNVFLLFNMPTEELCLSIPNHLRWIGLVFSGFHINKIRS